MSRSGSATSSLRSCPALHSFRSATCTSSAFEPSPWPAGRIRRPRVGELLMARPRLSRARRSGRGQALAEFALVFPFFMLALFAVIVFGLTIFYDQQVTNVAREAARYAAVNGVEAQCPTISHDPPPAPPFSYYRCDPPETDGRRCTLQPSRMPLGRGRRHPPQRLLVELSRRSQSRTRPMTRRLRTRSGAPIRSSTASTPRSQPIRHCSRVRTGHHSRRRRGQQPSR